MPNLELKRGQEVKDAFEIRRRVFMEEQGYTDEFDDIDDTCIHIVLYKDGEPAGCARTFPNPQDQRWAVGRVILPEKREGGLGACSSKNANAPPSKRGDRNVSAPSSDSRLVWPHGIRASAEVDYEDEGQPAHWMEKDHLAPLATPPCRSHPHSERFLGVAALAPD